MGEEEQELTLNNRELLKLSGVVDVFNFDDNTVVAETNLGNLEIKGEELNIQRLDIDSSQLVVNGHIKEIKYDQDINKGKSFLKRLFK